MRPLVLVATPSFERRPCVEYICSLMETKQVFYENEIDHVVTILGGDPYLGKVRNRLVGTLLTDHPTATDLFFIDDDVGWPAHKVLEFLRRPEDVVCGIYPKKQDNPEFPVSLLLDDGRPIQRDGLVLANLAPTGFMRIKRHVLERMAMEAGRYHEATPSGEQKVNWNIFEARFVDLEMERLRKSDLSQLTRAEAIAHLRRALSLVQGQDLGQFWGEDYWFTERWREMGGEVWVDPDIHFTHSGRKSWSATFGDTLRAVIAKQQEAA